MKNRMVSILTLGSFLVFSWSCYSIQEIKPAMLTSNIAGDYKIQKVEKTSGEVIEYSKESPGRVGWQGNITGNGMLTYAVEFVEVDSAGLEIISRPGAPFMNVRTQDGRIYGWVKKIDNRGDKSVLNIVKVAHGEYSSFTVLLTEVEKAWAKKFDVMGTVCAILVPVVLAVIVVLAFTASSWIGGGWLGGWKE
jgi:hypothetical protein